jgi:hypothetical protein
VGMEQDSWLQAIGVDPGLFQGSQGSASLTGVSNPTLGARDPELQGALVDTGVEFGKGFVKGVGDSAGAIVNSPAGQFTSGLINPTTPLATRAIDAAITGDPSKLAPPDPTVGIRNFDPNDPKQQQQAQADVQGLAGAGLSVLGFTDPVAMARDSADVLVNGDPNLVGQGSGRVFVAVVPALVTGGLAGLAEGGVAEAGAAESGAAKPPAVAAAGEAPAGAAAGEAPQPISTLDPALNDPFNPPPSSTPPSSSGFGVNDGPFGADGPNSGPFTPRAPSVPGSGDIPISFDDPVPASQPPAPVSPPPFDPSLFPDFDAPAPPRTPLPPDSFPGFGIVEDLPE